jgi:hypothetical protein
MDKIKVENETFVRDLNSNAILETDISKLNRYLAAKNALKEKDQKLDHLLDRINKLETIIERMTDGRLNT